MTRIGLITTCLVTLIVVTCCHDLYSQDDFCAFSVQDGAFCDDFSNGNATDPVRWSSNGRQMRVENEDLIIGFATANDFVYSGFSVRTQGRLVDNIPDGTLGIGGNLFSPLRGFGGFVNIDGLASIGANATGGPDGNEFFGEVQTDLRPFEEDIVMQFDRIGNLITFRAWRPNEPMPANPLLSSEYDRLGEVVPGVFASSDSLADATGVFRYVWADAQPIPEPSSVVPCVIGLFGVLRVRRPL